MGERESICGTGQLTLTVMLCGQGRLYESLVRGTDDYDVTETFTFRPFQSGYIK